MEHKTVYRCTGTCGGVSPAPKSCETKGCTHFGHPLQKVIQCDDSAKKTAETGVLQACEKCQVVK